MCGVSVLSAVSAAINLIAGGYSLQLGPFRLASHSFFRDLGFAVTSAVLCVAIWGRDAVDALAARVIVSVERKALWIAAVLSLATLVVGLVAATRCACAADAYGYVSQADLWAAGTLHVPQPLASVVPWPAPEWTLAPLGYRPATYPGAIVPTYAPGLPMAMAAAMRISGSRSAAFIVVPMLGAVTVWATFLLGRRLDTAVVGLFGALLVACSATFLFHLIQPMSDVPVTAWWMLAAVLLFRGTDRSAFLAGLACSAAVLTRPNLVPVVLVFLPFVGTWRTTINAERAEHAEKFKNPLRVLRSLRLTSRLAWFIAGALPGLLAVAWIQSALYGSPFISGYGKLHDIYALANAGPNIKLYPSWLWESHGPFVFIGLLSPLVLWVDSRYTPQRTAGRVVTFALAFSALLFIAYIFYSPFDNWTYTRFLLPAIPLLLLLGVWTLFVSARRLGSPAAQAVVLIAVIMIACSWVNHVVERGVLTTRHSESRYIAAGRYIAETMGPGAMVLSMQHSGSIRYYADRPIVRYDWLDGRNLDEAIKAMRAMNRHPVLVLDDWEEDKFRERFRGQRWGALDWPARVEFESQPKVRVYDPVDRDRFEAREPLQTVRVWMPR